MDHPFRGLGTFTERGVGVLPEWSYYVGIAVIVAGMAVRQWAVAVLGRCFSVAISVQKGQRVVDVGRAG